VAAALARISTRTKTNPSRPRKKNNAGAGKTPLNFLQAGRTAGPEQRRGRLSSYDHIPHQTSVKEKIKKKRRKEENQENLSA
jgi:hypothetical protein